MASIRKTKTLHYDDYMNTRQRVARFLTDNANTYLDYPENTLRRVDLEDTEKLQYYTGPFANYCFYGGFAGTVGLGLAVAVFNRTKATRGVKLLSLLVPFIPMIGSTFVHYSVTGQFLDYCAVKYQDRGLWDVELWEYHKGRHSEGEVEKEWSIGSKQ